MDAAAWDVARFGGWAGRAYTLARTAWWYERRSHRVYPYQQVAAGRPARTSPVYTDLKDRGAVFGESFGMEVPLWFARDGEAQAETYAYTRPHWLKAVEREGKATAEHAGLFEISSYAKYEVTGPEAGSWLDFVLAGRLPAADGRATLSPMLSHAGRLVGDVSVVRLAARRFLLVGSGAAQAMHMRWFGTLTPRDGSVRVENRSPALSGLHIAGPASHGILAGLAPRGFALPFLGAAVTELGPCPEAIVVRVSYTGEAGYEIYMAPEYQRALLFALLDAGGDRLALAGSRTLMNLRLEKGWPSWGLDLGADTMPSDTALSRFVDFAKEDFIGKAPALAAKNRWPQARPALLSLDRSSVDGTFADASGGETVLANGVYAGYVTSGGYGPRTGLSLAYAYLKPDAPAEGLEVEVTGVKIPAAVLQEAPYDPKGARLRG
jgi:dimethylglycine dehydrogenase